MSDLTIRPSEGPADPPNSGALALELSTAAGVLRAHLNAPGLTPSPWLSIDGGDRLVHAGPGHEDRSPLYVVGEPMENGANADYVALMDPGIGEVLFEQLLFSAEWALMAVDVEQASVEVRWALRIARLINGRPR